MIDTDKHDWDNQPLAHEVPYWMRHMYDNALMIIARKDAEVKRLRERLMLAESALGEVRACHEDGQGNLGEILEHYRDKEGVEMPNAFDEVIK